MPAIDNAKKGYLFLLKGCQHHLLSRLNFNSSILFLLITFLLIIIPLKINIIIILSLIIIFGLSLMISIIFLYEAQSNYEKAIEYWYFIQRHKHDLFNENETNSYIIFAQKLIINHKHINEEAINIGFWPWNDPF